MADQVAIITGAARGVGRRCAALLTLAGCVVLLACGPATAAAATRSAQPRAPEVALAPSIAAPAGATVTMAPVGLSLEYPVMAASLGAGPCPPPALVAELRRLGSPPIQLGGASQDMTAPAGAAPVPPGSWETATLFQLPAGFWTQLHCLLSASADPLTVGLNMRLGNQAWAAQIATEARAAATNGLSFSLGNEPDLYELPNYASLDKPLPNADAVAANLYLQLAGYLRPALGGAPVIGPEMSRPQRWRAQMPGLIAQLHQQTVGVHVYPLSVCRTASEATIPGLLSSRAADAPTRLAWVVAVARSAGLPAIVSEANSVSCGGRAGVSDTPAAAVWAVRFVLSALKTGFAEVRLHFSGNPYDPFLVRGGEVIARPLEPALVALGAWLPLGATIRTVALHGLAATAVGRPGGAVTLILDNESGRSQALVLRSARTVRLQRLRAARAGLASGAVVPRHGRVPITIGANEIVAVSSIP